MKPTRIFSLLATIAVAVFVLAALMTSLALAHDNILAHVHMPLQSVDVDGDGDTESFLANFHVFDDNMAEGTMQWKDAHNQGILRFENGQVSCAAELPTLDLLGTLSTGSRSGKPELSRYIAATVTPIRYTPHFTCTDFPGPYQCAAFTIEVDPAVYDNINVVGGLAFDFDLCE
jgi:hypothetical protein